MPNTGIVRGQVIRRVKLEVAREARRKMTAAESALWARLRANQLHGLHFRRQQPVSGLRVDFYCNAAGVIVEVDGPIHEGQREADQIR